MAYWRKVNKQLRVNKQLTISNILNFHSRHLCLEQFQCLELLLTRFQEEEKVPLIDLRAPPQVKINETRFAHSVRTWGQLSLSLVPPYLPFWPSGQWLVRRSLVSGEGKGLVHSYMRLQNYLRSCCCPRSSAGRGLLGDFSIDLEGLVF